MITLTEVWKCLTDSEAVPSWLPDMIFQEIMVETFSGKAEQSLVVLPDEVGSEELDRMVGLGAIGIISNKQLSSEQPINWLDTAVHYGEEEDKEINIEQPIGLIVSDIQSAIINLSTVWRGQSQTQVICLLGAEGLRTAQRVTQSVLKQRFRTIAPDILCCDVYSTALALLEIRQSTERLLLRMNLQDEESVEFLTNTVRPHIVAVNNMFPTQNDRSQYNMWFENHLISALAADTLMIINGDDPIVQNMSIRSPATVFCYGLQAGPSCALWTSQIESEGREGLRLWIHYKEETVHVRVPLLGRYSIHTALAASAIGLISGESWEEIVAGLRTMTAQLHLIMTPGINGALLVEDSYGATPASTLSILNLLEELQGRKIAVLGDMVELTHLAKDGHKKVGRRVFEVAGYLITRGKLGRLIGQEAIDCGMPEVSVYMASDNQDAAEKLEEVIQPEDIVVVCGAEYLCLKEIVDKLIDSQASICEV